jgi:hypothetical protein
VTQPDSPAGDAASPNTVSRRPSLIPGGAADRLGPRTQAGAGDNLRMLSELGAPARPAAPPSRFSPLWMALAGVVVLAGALGLWQLQLRERDAPKPPPTFATPDTARATAATQQAAAGNAAPPAATPTAAAAAPTVAVAAAAPPASAAVDPAARAQAGPGAAAMAAEPARIENLPQTAVATAPAASAAVDTATPSTARSMPVGETAAAVAAAAAVVAAPTAAAGTAKPTVAAPAAKPAPRRETVSAAAAARPGTSPSSSKAGGVAPEPTRVAAAPVAVLVERPAAPGAAADTAPLLTRSLKDASASRRGVAGEEVAPTASNQTAAAAPAPAARSTATAATTRGKDADVDLLAALVAHVASSNNAQARQPLAQQDQLTIAGIVRRCDTLGGQEARDCRRKICDGYWGKADACPAKARGKQ